MRIIGSCLVLLSFAAVAYTQQVSTPQCELQELAIDAALGDIQAQYNLGVEFFKGATVKRDYARGATLWGKASAAGHIAASNNLGFLKYYGRPGVERDYAEGIRLWRFAAERGFPESQVHLAQAYSDGRFLKPDFIEAYAWAMAGKHYSSKISGFVDDADLTDAITRDAEEALEIARGKLNKLETAQAEKKAAEYIRKFAPQ